MTASEERLAAMDAALARIRRIGDAQSLEADGLSYGVLPFDLSEYWDGTVARFHALVERFAHFASVESLTENGVQARSVLSWTGDLAIVWDRAVSPEQRRAHFALLEADVRFRARMILIVTESVAAASSLCAAAASPLLAPAAFRSVAKLVSELQGLWQQAELE